MLWLYYRRPFVAGLGFGAVTWKVESAFDYPEEFED